MCSRSTLYRHYRQYFKSTIVPKYLDSGKKVGRPPFIPPHRISELNSKLMYADGEAVDMSSLRRSLMNITNDELVARNNVSGKSIILSLETRHV